MASGTLLLPGQAVQEGDGPVRCHAPGDDGRCWGFVGLPAVGSVLFSTLGPGGRLEECEAGFAAFRCSSCGRLHVYATPWTSAA